MKVSVLGSLYAHRARLPKLASFREITASTMKTNCKQAVGRTSTFYVCVREQITQP